VSTHRRVFPLLAALALACDAADQPTAPVSVPPLRLTGIVELSSTNLACFVRQPVRWGANTLDLLPEHVGAHVDGVEVLRIHPPEGKVRVRLEREEMELSLPTRALAPAAPQGQVPPHRLRPAIAAEADTVRLVLADMPSEQFLNVYSRLSQRTILRPSKLPTFTLTLTFAEPRSRHQAVRELDAALETQGLAAIPDGDKFVVVVPVKWRERVPQVLARARGAPASQLFPQEPADGALVLSFRDLPFAQFLDFYGELLGRTVVNRETPRVPISLTLLTHGDLTRREAVYALEVWLALHDVQVVFPDEKRFQVVYPAPVIPAQP